MRIITILTLALLVFSGCQQTAPEPVAGVVGYAKDLPIGTYSPRVAFTSAEGKQTTLRKASEPISIIAFVSSTGQVCCRIDPSLAEMAEKFKDELITVVQISLPTSDCSHGPGCVEVCNLFDRHLVLLCDQDKVAWRAYGQPKPNTVFLINEENEVVAVESIADLKEVEVKAKQLSDEIVEVAAEASET